MAGQLEIVQLEPLGGEIRLDHLPNVCYLVQIFGVSTPNRWVPKAPT
jgi:hypothetical protein